MYDIPPNATLRRRIRADPKEFRHSRETNIVDTPTQDIYDTPVQHDVDKVRVNLMYQEFLENFEWDVRYSTELLAHF